jgi:hypothetical protein
MAVINDTLPTPVTFMSGISLWMIADQVDTLYQMEH